MPAQTRQKFAVIGCGRIGTASALRAKSFGYDVRFYDPYRPSGYEKAIGVTRVHSLEEILRSADVVDYTLSGRWRLTAALDGAGERGDDSPPAMGQ